MKRSPILGTILVTALAMGCNEAQDENVPASGPPAIAGGTLEVAEVDGRQLAVASDPARAAVYLVDLSDRRELARINLGENDEPGRIAIDPSAGRAYVVLRRAGQVATVDLRAHTLVERRAACAAPRGIDLDPDTRDLWVACAEGIVVRMPTSGSGVTETVKLAPDLRDVVAQPGEGTELWVSRFRSAEILVYRNGEVTTHEAPGSEGAFIGGREMSASVAWRMRRIEDGRVLLVHQQSQTSQLGTLGMPALGAQYYGGSCDRGVVRSYVSMFDGDRFYGEEVGQTSLAVDGAVAGSAVALAAAAEPGVPLDSGNPLHFNGVRAVATSDVDQNFDSPNGCGIAPVLFDRPRAAVAVAVLPDNHVVAQYRDPAEIVIGTVGIVRPDFTGGFGPSTADDSVSGTVSLSGGRVEHAGHALMHEAAGTGATCASCHPEGGDDGHIWNFDTGPRRTQTMTGGILDTAPFHWGGDVANVNAVMEGTFVGRMGGAFPAEDELRSFETWVDALPALPGIVEDATQVERGQQVFAEQGCVSCHSGDKLTNNEMGAVAAADDIPSSVRLREVQVPALYEVMYHAPYFHNGAAESLDELVTMHHGTDLDEARRSDLVAYLRSL